MIKRLKRKVISFLRWSEKYTKTDMVYLAKGGGWLTFGQGFQVLAGLGLSIAFANLLPQETYGVYKYIISASAIIGAFTLSGMGTAITQSVARGYDAALKVGAREVLRWSAVMIAVALGAAGYYYLQGNNTLAVAMGIIAIFQPIIKTTSLYQNYLDGKKWFKQRSLYLTTWELLEVFIVVTTLFFTDNVLIILGIFFFTNAAIAGFFYFYSAPKTISLLKRKSTNLISYAKHLSVMQSLSLIIKHIDKVLVFQFLGAPQLAIYAFATLPIDRAKSLLRAIPTLALPKFSNTDETTLKRTLPKKVLLFFLICFAGVGIFILAAPTFYSLLFPQYINSVIYTQVYSVVLLSFPLSLFHNALTAHQKKKSLYKLNIIYNVSKIAFLIVLLSSYQIWGAIIALIIARLMSDFFSGIFFYFGETAKK